MINFIKKQYTNNIINPKKKVTSTSLLAKIFGNKVTGDFIFIENGPEINIQTAEFYKKVKKNKRDLKKNLYLRIIKKRYYKRIKKMKYFQKKYPELFKEYDMKIINIIPIIIKNIVERPMFTVRILPILRNIFEKSVIIQKIIIKTKSGNARILAKYIGYLCLEKKYNRVKKVIKKGAWIDHSLTKPNEVVGLKVTINGRLKTGRITPRKTKKSFTIGRFKKSSNLKVARVVAKNYKGQYSITVKIAII